MKHLLVGMVLAGTIMLLATPVTAQNHYPLEIIRPLPPGPTGTGLHASNRIYRAYQGIPYTIKADAIGGRWPYTYSLSGQPSGMTINAGPCPTIGPSCTAGTIEWTNPQASAASITVRICDADNDCVSTTWGITVSTTIGANGFCFINADSGNDTTGNGSPATPWRTFSKAKASCGARSILYFRGATASYNFLGVTPSSQWECGVNGKVRMTESTGPIIFIGYPGESPVFDMDTGYTALAPCFEMFGTHTWISNMTFRDCYHKCFEMQRDGQYGITFWNNTVINQGPGEDSTNSAVLMFGFLGTGNQAYFDLVENNTISGLVAGTGNSCFKFYSARKSVTAYNSFTTIAADECVAPKMAVSQYTIRGNVFQGITGSAIWGNQMNGNSSATRTYGEILFNNVKDSTDYTLQLNQHGTADETFVYRNTFQGLIQVWNASSTNGPFNFTDNVIVSSRMSGGSCPARITCYQVTDYSKIVLTGNVQGAASDSIVNANGELQGGYRSTWIGLRGVELSATSGGGGGGGGDITSPIAPQNLRVVN